MQALLFLISRCLSAVPTDSQGTFLHRCQMLLDFRGVGS
ncbi:unnamed protein product [Prunus brigantina]